jgi:hypothetical protein
LQGRGSFQDAIYEHASGSVRGLAAWLSTFDDQNRRPAFSQGDRKREADDASADDDYVPSLHLGIVKEPKRKPSEDCNVDDRKRRSA